MTELYPLSFAPIHKERPWGSERWLLSGLEGSQSTVISGFLEENEINELIEVYMGEMVGDEVYQKFGNEFPLLVKILDIQDYLSFQVHPGDQIAKERHNAYGKAEAWYILKAEPDAKIYLGFNRPMERSQLTRRCLDQTLPEVMNEITPQAGDFFYIPPGTVHAAGGGVTVLEIQQVSDITYRVFDWGREFYKETAREMHLELALDVIDWEQFRLPDSDPVADEVASLVATPWFEISKRVISAPIPLTNTFGDGFRLLICINGEVRVRANESVLLQKGGLALVPAAVTEYRATPLCPGTEVLEVWLPIG